MKRKQYSDDDNNNNELTKETKLVGLCVGRYSGLGKCFQYTEDGARKSMLVEDLCGYTQERLKKHVKDEGGPHGLVPAWLTIKDLEQYLKASKTEGFFFSFCCFFLLFGFVLICLIYCLSI